MNPFSRANCCKASFKLTSFTSLLSELTTRSRLYAVFGAQSFELAPDPCPPLEFVSGVLEYRKADSIMPIELPTAPTARPNPSPEQSDTEAGRRVHGPVRSVASRASTIA